MSEITPELLLHGYSIGIFPMAEHRDDPEVFWVDPRKRGILPLDGFHLSRSLARTMRRGQFQISLNHDFDSVVAGCANRDETWISQEIFSLYKELHQMDRAHSLEVWSGTTLVGGVYGVTLGAAFFGESMFSTQTDASKVALACLVNHLRRTGYQLFDTQFLTDHLASLGAVEITRAVYQSKLADALETDADILSVPIDPVQDVLQRMTQMS